MKIFKSLVILLIIQISCNNEPTSPNLEIRGLKGIVKDINGNLLSNVDVFLIFDFESTTKKVASPTDPDSVILTSFTASLNGNRNVVLYWTTASELNNMGFEIERRYINDNEFIKIGFVQGSGTTNEPRAYFYVDAGLLYGIYRYRLKQIDFDGSFNYSPELEIDISPPIEFSVNQNYPNPFQMTSKMIFSLPYNSEVKILVHSFFTKDTIKVLLNDLKFAGNHIIEMSQFISLPNNLYEIEFIADYENNTYRNEILVMKNYSDTNNISLLDRSFLQTNNGEFVIDFSKMPFEKIFNYTSETSPDILGNLKIKPKLTIVLSKSGFNTLIRTFDLNINSFLEVEFILNFN